MSRITRRLLFLSTAVSLTGLTIGAAASLPFASNGIGAARQAVPRCTSAGLGLIQNLSGSNVVSVTVSGLPSACGGATLQLTYNNGAANSGGAGSVPAGGGSATVALAVAVAVTGTAETDLVMVGP